MLRPFKPENFIRTLITLSLLITNTSIDTNHLVYARNDLYLDSNIKTLYLPIVTRDETPQWIGPPGGSVVSMVTDPHNPAIIYAGSWGAGVYKSTNGGKGWYWAGNGLGVLQIDSLAIDPKDSQVLYAGTHRGGVYKTTNGGQSWFPSRVGMFAEAVVYTIAVNPGNPQLVYAGTRGNPGEAPGPPWGGILYKSTNGGSSWRPVLTNVGGSAAQDWVYSVAIDPSSPDRILAATHEHGVYIADDYGGSDDWQPAGSVGDMSGRAVAFDPRNWTNRAYYATWHGDGIYRSSDGGFEWDRSNAGLGFAKIYPNGIAIVPSSPDILYLASFGELVHGVMKSTNAGASWARAGLGNLYIYSVQVPIQNNQVVFAGTLLDGFYRSEDGGGNWIRYNDGFINSSVTGIVLYNAKTMFSSTWGGGVFVSYDGGNKWAGFNTNLNDRFVHGIIQHPDNPAIIFALTESNGLKRYDLTNQSGWETVVTSTINMNFLDLESLVDDPIVRHEPIEELESRTGIRKYFQSELSSINAPLLALAFAPSDSRVVYLGTQGAGIYISRDSGSTWYPAGLSGQIVRSITVQPDKPDHVYAAIQGTGVIKFSSNGGHSWSDIIISVLTKPEVYSLAFMGDAPAKLYAGTNNGIWQYHATEWISSGLQGMAVPTLADDPTWSGLFFAGTNSGAYTSIDGLNWNRTSDEAVGYTVQTMAINPSDPNHIFLGTTTRGTLRVFIP